MIDRLFVAVCAGELESVAVTVKPTCPAVVGVPLIAPALLSESPAGSVPGGTVHVTGAVPPDDCERRAGVGRPATPDGSDVVVTPATRRS